MLIRINHFQGCSIGFKVILFSVHGDLFPLLLIGTPLDLVVK